MKKFTLYPNDKELNFRMNQLWDWDAPVTVIKNSYCYKYFPNLVARQKVFATELGMDWRKDFLTLEVYKGNNSIAYKLKDIQLDFKGDGNKIKITSIEVTADEENDTAKIKIHAQQEASLIEKILMPIDDLFYKIKEKLYEIGNDKKVKEYNKKEAKRAFIEKKAKETITNEY